MQNQNDLAANLKHIFNPNSYDEFGEGFFINQPRMTGYYYFFKKLNKPRFCLILNTSQQQYPSDLVKIKDCVFLIYNVPSLEEFIENLGEKYFQSLITNIDQNMQKKNQRNLPYGYYIDENGDMKVDLKQAHEVKCIYDRYIETESVRDIAAEMNTNFSFVRDILHDSEEYMQMQPKILSITTMKKVAELLGMNVKGTFKKETTKDRLEAARERNKKLEQQKLATQSIAGEG